MMKNFNGLVNWAGAVFMLVLLHATAQLLGLELENLLLVGTFIFVVMLYLGRRDA